jgi:hypothetical protein
MPDDKRIAACEPYEVRDWARKSGVSEADLALAPQLSAIVPATSGLARGPQGAARFLLQATGPARRACRSSRAATPRPTAQARSSSRPF